MKEIDGLIACSHYGVIEWLCTHDPTANADVDGKRSPWGCGYTQSPPCPRSWDSHPSLAVLLFLEISGFIQRHRLTPPHPISISIQLSSQPGHRDQVLKRGF